jgi:hypothetical protein
MWLSANSLRPSRERLLHIHSELGRLLPAECIVNSNLKTKEFVANHEAKSFVFKFQCKYFGFPAWIRTVIHDSPRNAVTPLV